MREASPSVCIVTAMMAMMLAKFAQYASIKAFTLPSSPSVHHRSTNHIGPYWSPRSSHLFSTASPAASTSITNGLTKTILVEGSGPTVQLGQVATVSYCCSLSTSSSSSSTNPQIFAQSKKQKMIIGDGAMIRGWDQAIATMRVGEKALVHVQDADTFGYGKEGVKGFIPPNAELDLEIEILDVEDNVKGMGVGSVTGMTGSGDLGMLDPSKPRTPEAIAAAYKARQDQMVINKANEKEGLEGLLEKAKNFYFFGFFEGETGEQAPWFLRPSITFPIAFAVVGAGFYLTFALGGISERGAQITDELDDIVLSMNMIKDAVILAMKM
mmetsp:Transcript_8587/g.16208  ORF Transcript_8587/g.16208 Transcript_8587/m.16208 type:complete len:326 (+) Transcript_8587:140-1117(+)